MGWSANSGLWLVTPGITALEYAQRRSRLANKLPKGAIAVLASSEVKYRAPGIFHEYRQESNFFYLTGRFPQTKAGRIWSDHGFCARRIQRTECPGNYRK